MIFKIIFHIYLWWSNFIYHNTLSDFSPVESFEITEDWYELKKLLQKVNRDFHYKHDDITVLFDAMPKPAQAYHDWFTDNFKDDCDGFHAAIYHILHENGLDPFMISYFAKKVSKSHVMCGFIYNKKYYIIDYTNIVSGYTLKEALSLILNRRKADIYAYNIAKYNYKKHKYYVYGGSKWN